MGEDPGGGEGDKQPGDRKQDAHFLLGHGLLQLTTRDTGGSPTLAVDPGARRQGAVTVSDQGLGSCFHHHSSADPLFVSLKPAVPCCSTPRGSEDDVGSDPTPPTGDSGSRFHPHRADLKLFMTLDFRVPQNNSPSQERSLFTRITVCRRGHNSGPAR